MMTLLSGVTQNSPAMKGLRRKKPSIPSSGVVTQNSPAMKGLRRRSGVTLTLGIGHAKQPCYEGIKTVDIHSILQARRSHAKQPCYEGIKTICLSFFCLLRDAVTQNSPAMKGLRLINAVEGQEFGGHAKQPCYEGIKTAEVFRFPVHPVTQNSPAMKGLRQYW